MHKEGKIILKWWLGKTLKKVRTSINIALFVLTKLYIPLFMKEAVVNTRSSWEM